MNDEKATGKAKAGRDVWVAYHDDWSEFACFGQELTALRYAIEHGMEVGRVPYGKPVRAALRGGS